MIFTVRFYGVLAMVLGVQSGAPVSLDLIEGSEYGSVLDAIHQKYGDRVPPAMWDGEKGMFSSGVLAFGDEGRFLPRTRSVSLPKCGEIRFHLPLSGG